MKEILAYKKETENKYRWDAIVDDALFELYIPKWRIPQPVPERILISIFTEKKDVHFKEYYNLEELLDNNDLKREPIIAELGFKNEHAKTYRYDPINDKNQWEIGSPYIPKSLLEYKIINRVYIKVEWK